MGGTIRLAIRRAAAVIRGGGLVAFPTETVYGLGADARSAAAVAGIYRAKGRPAHDPCIVHLADATDLGQAVALAALPARTARQLDLLSGRFWPGPLSLILPRGPDIPPSVTAGGPHVAVRVPAHPAARALIRAAGVPIAAPSANRFMHTSPTSARHVLDDLDGRIDLILDGGPSPLGVESSVLDLTASAAAAAAPRRREAGGAARAAGRGGRPGRRRARGRRCRAAVARAAGHPLCARTLV